MFLHSPLPPNNIDDFQVAFANNLKCRKMVMGDSESRISGIGEDTGRIMLLRHGVWCLVSNEGMG